MRTLCIISMMVILNFFSLMSTSFAKTYFCQQEEDKLILEISTFDDFSTTIITLKNDQGRARTLPFHTEYESEETEAGCMRKVTNYSELETYQYSGTIETISMYLAPIHTRCDLPTGMTLNLVLEGPNLDLDGNYFCVGSFWLRDWDFELGSQ